MNNKLHAIFVLFIGVIIGIILLIFGEIIKFSHLNLAPFGGQSWALWYHPVAISIGFLLSAKIFKTKHWLLITSCSLIVSLIVFSFVYSDNLFINIVPFGL